MRRFQIEIPFTLREVPSEEVPKPFQDPDGRSGTFRIEIDAETPDEAIEIVDVFRCLQALM